MKRRVGTSGFTIVETMIVLAVTGALFAMIATSLSGRQRSNEFIQSVNDVRTQIQQTITEIQNGYYPNDNKFTCVVTGGNTVSFTDATQTQQGKNTACVFLGKMLQFRSNSSPNNVIVYPVAGIRTAATISTADPTVTVGGNVDESTTFNLLYGLTVQDMQAGGSKVGAFGVLSSLDSNNSGKSGDQQFDLYAFNNIPLDSAKVTQSVNPDLSLKNPLGGIKICLKSGGTKQFGLITVGNNGGQLSVDLQIMDSSHSNCDLP